MKADNRSPAAAAIQPHDDSTRAGTASRVHFTIEADHGNQVVETNESNNTAVGVCPF